MLKMDLSDEVLNQIGLGSESSPNRSVDFDSSGTLHVKSIGDDGSVVRDTPLHNNPIEVKDYTREEDSLNEDIKESERRNRLLRMYFYIVMFGFVFAVAGAVLLVLWLR